MPIDIGAAALAAVVGLVIGWLASVVLGGASGMLGSIMLGIVGAVVGTYLLALMQLGLPIGDPIIAQIFIAAVGALLVLGAARLLMRG
jgi:uncharacterized membrane protein YeaQ/YmgE (transglycosylase-associated protein family)